MITLTPLNNPEGATQQEYSASQEALIPVVDSTSEFNPVTDQVIFSVETVTGEVLSSGKVSNFITGIRKPVEPPKPKFDAPVIISIVIGALGLIVGIIVLMRK